MPVNLLDNPEGPDFWRQAFDVLNKGRLAYIARYWRHHVFREYMDGVDPDPEHFIVRLDALMRRHPEIN